MFCVNCGVEFEGNFCPACGTPAYKYKSRQKIYLYCRVSTKKQQEGNGLDIQELKLLGKYPDGIVYKEVYSGATNNRPKLYELLQIIKSGDILAVTKLDRLSRDAEEGVRLIDGLKDLGVKIDILDLGIIDNTNIGEIHYEKILRYSEVERIAITERCQEGRQYAREHKEGYKEGRKTKITPAIEKLVLELIDKGYSYRRVEEEYGIKRGTVYKIVKLNKEKDTEINEGTEFNENFNINDF